MGGDGQMDPRDMPALLDPIAARCRRLRQGQSLPPPRRVARDAAGADRRQRVAVGGDARDEWLSPRVRLAVRLHRDSSRRAASGSISTCCGRATAIRTICSRGCTPPACASTDVAGAADLRRALEERDQLRNRVAPAAVRAVAIVGLAPGRASRCAGREDRRHHDVVSALARRCRGQFCRGARRRDARARPRGRGRRGGRRPTEPSRIGRDLPAIPVRIPRLFFAAARRIRSSARRAAARRRAFTARLTAAVVRRARHWDRAIAHWLGPRRSPRSRRACRSSRSRTAAMSTRSRAFIYLRPSRAARAPAALAFVCQLTSLRALAARAPRRARPTDGHRRRSLRRACRARRTRSILILARLVPIKGIDLAITRRARSAVARDRRRRPRRATRTARTSRSSARSIRARRDELLVDRVARDHPVARAAERPHRRHAARRARSARGRVPVIASRTGGLADLPVIHVPPDDPPALAAAIDRRARRASTDRAWTCSARVAGGRPAPPDACARAHARNGLRTAAVSRSDHCRARDG